MGDGQTPKTGMKRRDFLAGAGAMALSGPLLARAAVAQGTGPGIAPAGARVARLGIYPAIGICRVGGSKLWFHAPEVPGLPPQPADGQFKDGTEKIKKQVQRFRIYAFDRDGRVIKEITAADGTIQWTVHVANTKAAWYGFNNPMDNGELAPGIPGQRRNQYFTRPEQRLDNLVIDGGATTISGTDTNPDGSDEAFAMGGTFWGSEAVGLGHLQTDAAGHLLVVPPDGVSKSPTGAGITSFADNNGWHDDWCDGPVTATVTLSDALPVEPDLDTTADAAWVACVGPNFAPEIAPVSTMYDVIYDMNVRLDWQQRPAKPSFTKDIYPTLQRLGQMQWLTDAANLREAWMGEYFDFADPALIDRLSDPANAQLRAQAFAQIRPPFQFSGNTVADYFTEQQLKVPYMLGDGINYDGSPYQWFQMVHLQYQFLIDWKDGNYVDDWNPDETGITDFDEIPLDQQPFALTQAALMPLSGGAFHPGVELTYYLRHKNMYARAHPPTDGPLPEPFRLARGDRPTLLQDLGLLLTPELTLTGDPDNGIAPAVGPCMPGDLTRWMGLPWQCDAFSCQQVLMQSDFPTAVWWPALLPIDVLPVAFLDDQVIRGETQDGQKLDRDQRIKFFNQRADWKRGVAGIGYHANASYWDGITDMITLWERMGFVVKRQVPDEVARELGIPREVYAEVQRGDTMEFRFKWKPADGQLPN